MNIVASSKKRRQKTSKSSAAPKLSMRPTSRSRSGAWCGKRAGWLSPCSWVNAHGDGMAFFEQEIAKAVILALSSRSSFRA